MIVYPILVKWMVHPALHKLTTDRSECEARPGMMWAARGGNEGMLMVHVCVEFTRLPLGRWTMMGLVVGAMLFAGASVVSVRLTQIGQAYLAIGYC
jgi:hypothetical protein